MIHVVLRVLAATLIPGAFAAGTMAAQDARDTRVAGGSSATLHLVERHGTQTFIDSGKVGDSQGDLLAFSNLLYDGDNLKRVGRDQGTCTRTMVGAAWECNWTVLLPNGQITVEGPFNDTSDSVLAVIGGTGIYVGVSGQMTLHARDVKGLSYDFVYTLG
jgi:allene oxide cyclase